MMLETGSDHHNNFLNKARGAVPLRDAPVSGGAERSIGATSVLDLPGVAAIGAGALLKLNGKMYGDVLGDPDSAGLVDMAGKSGSKRDCFAKYVKAVNASAALSSCMPPGVVDEFRKSKELRRALHPGLSNESVRERIEQRAADAGGVAAKRVTDSSAQTGNDATVIDVDGEVKAHPWFDMFGIINENFLKPPEFMTNYVTPANVKMMRNLRLCVAALKPLSMARFAFQKFTTVVDYVVDEPSGTSFTEKSSGTDAWFTVAMSTLSALAVAMYMRPVAAVAPWG
jgi:hypothetical protein